MNRVEDGRYHPRMSAGDGEIKHPGAIDVPRERALDISPSRAPRKGSGRAYVRGQRRLIERQRP
jgi:hypothetical protein